ncbi:hypothetical protein [Saccharothrix sp. HUAS TT1]|uniref:hypothetical protein n=1 Tax=unclassified Saccharothrix TaxID=2593673 RepID=UPI00345B5FE9
MPTKYTLTVRNESTQFQNLCVYQQAVDLGVRNVMSLAWLTAPAWPHTTVTFEWNLDYSFTWSYTGALKPGVKFRAQEVRRANPQDLTANQVLFDYSDGAHRFLDGRAFGTAELGNLYIRELPSVPADGAAVGIGMSNSGVFAVQAQPNENLVFTPHPSYWLTAGTYSHGEVLDIEQITNSAQLNYDAGFELNALLRPDNTWSVNSGPASLLAA